MQRPLPPPGTRLGTTRLKSGKFEFRIWAPAADSVRVRVWKNHDLLNEHAEAIADTSLNYIREWGLWEAKMDFRHEGSPTVIWYRYEISRDGRSMEILDPYARACSEFDGQTLPASVYLGETFADGASEAPRWKSPVADRGAYRHPSQAVIYEIHVRDASSDSASEVPALYRGTYYGMSRALTAAQKLGATHIELLPIQLFARTNEMDRNFEDSYMEPQSANYNWGYDPIHFFIPTAWYAKDPSNPASRVDDLRRFVAEAHRRGIRVLLDVVFNHSARTDFWEMIAPHYWFRENADGTLANASGCGNDFETTRPMFRRMMIESLCWFVEQYDVDGFRFDLMGLIDRETMEDAFRAIKELKPDALMIGEGWKLYNGPSGSLGMDQDAVAGDFPVAVFNDELRDLLKGGGFNESLKGFLHGAEIPLKQLFMNILGLPQVKYGAARPWNNVNYIESHDGLTLFDNLAWNLGLDVENAESAGEVLRRAALGILLLCASGGIVFFQAGQERGRDKRVDVLLPWMEGLGDQCGPFVRNSYRSSDAVNAIRWRASETGDWLANWCSGLLKFRRSRQGLWMQNGETRHAAATLFKSDNPSVISWSDSFEGELILWAVNVSRTQATVTIPPRVGKSLDRAFRQGSLLCHADRTRSGSDGIESAEGYRINDGNIDLEGLSAVILSAPSANR